MARQARLEGGRAAHPAAANLPALVNVAIVAPCPVPYTAGGAENLWRGLQDALNERAGCQAEIIKLPSPEHDAASLLDSYRRFAELDLSGFDAVVSGKYPAWMIGHPRHVCWMLHRLRGLYDSYHFFGLPEAYPDPPPAVRELSEWMRAHAGRRDALGEVFERVDALRRSPALSADLFAFPGPLVREIVHHLDGVGLAPSAVRRFGAISATVRDRPGYFPDGRGRVRGASADVARRARAPAGVVSLHGQPP